MPMPARRRVLTASRACAAVISADGPLSGSSLITASPFSADAVGSLNEAFYRAMGCVEAEVYNRQHVEKEPYDCQLECKL